MLGHYGATASFFACGINLEKFPELADKVVAAGHGLFSHCYDHRALDTLEPAAIIDQLERTELLLRRHRPSLGAPLVRFPFGAGADLEAVRLPVAAWNPATVAVQWSLCAEEWTFIDACRTPIQIQDGTMAGIRRLGADWDRAVVVMHDWPSQPAKPLTAAFCASLLEQYLSQVARLGLTPVTLPA